MKKYYNHTTAWEDDSEHPVPEWMKKITPDDLNELIRLSDAMEAIEARYKPRNTRPIPAIINVPEHIRARETRYVQ
jgi:hypothetical protein